MSKATSAAFVGSLAVITWREINNPQPGAPLPLPMPYRYVGAAIVYGILEFMSEIWNPKISDTLAVAYFLMLLISTAQNGIAHNAGGATDKMQKIKPQPVNPNNPAGGNPLNNPGTLTGPGFLNPPPGMVEE
jgi:hypothetical protein